MSTHKKRRQEMWTQWDAAVERLLAQTAYVGSADPHDPQRQLMERRLLEDFPGMHDHHRLEILETGRSPYKIVRSSARHGWSAKIKGDTILIEWYETGKRDDRQTMTIPLADWPTTTRAWRPNLAFAQREVLWLAVTAMVKRVFGDNSTKSGVIISVTQDCDAIRSKIRELVADDWPNPAPRRGKKSAKPPKAKVITIPGEAEKVEGHYKFGARLADLFTADPEVASLSAPLPEPPLPVQEPTAEDTLIILRKSALREFQSELEALRVEVEALRGQQKRGN